MLFSSIPFLYYFLPLVLAVYFLTPRAGKNAVLFLSSLLFYAWGEPRFCIFMLLSILQGYVFGRLIEKHAQNKKRSKLFLTASVALSLALLAYCKYADFFISSLNAVTGASAHQSTSDRTPFQIHPDNILINAVHFHGIAKKVSRVPRVECIPGEPKKAIEAVLS